MHVDARELAGCWWWCCFPLGFGCFNIKPTSSDAFLETGCFLMLIPYVKSRSRIGERGFKTDSGDVVRFANSNVIDFGFLSFLGCGEKFSDQDSREDWAAHLEQPGAPEAYPASPQPYNRYPHHNHNHPSLLALDEGLARALQEEEEQRVTRAPQTQEMSPDYQGPNQPYPRSWPRAYPPRTMDDLRGGDDSRPIPQQGTDTPWIIDAWRFLRSIPRQVRGTEPEPGSPRTQNDNNNNRDNQNNNLDNALMVEPEPPSKEFKKVVQKLKRVHAKGADLPPEFISSISLEVLEEPVCTIDGQTYDREHISKWFRSKGPGNITSPLTGKRLSSTVLIPNHTLRANMMMWVEQNRID